MAIDIQFRGLGEDFLATIREATELTEKFKGAVVSTNDAQTKGAQQVVAAQEQVQTTLQGSVIAVDELGKKSVQQGRVLSAELDKAAQSSLKLEGALTEVERTDLQKLVNQAKAVAVAEGTIIKPLDAQKKARLDQLVQLKGITAEEGKLLGEVIEVTEALKQQAPATEVAASATVSLKTQFLQAKNEAAAMITTFGEFSPEAIQATRRAAELKDQIGDLNQRIDSLNPDGRGLGAFAKLGTVLTGGAQALGGFFAAFGTGGSQIQEAALKLQSFVLGVQGAKEFFSGFSDALKDVRIALGLTTEAQRVSTVASAVDTTVKEGQATATIAVGTASTTAATGVRTFFAAFLSSPLGPLLLILGAVAAAVAYFSTKTAEARRTYEQFIDTINNREARVDLDAELKRAQLQRDLAKEEAARIADAEAGRRKSSERTIEELKRDAAREAAIDRDAAKRSVDLNAERQRGFKALQELKRQSVETDGLERIKDITDEKKFADLRKALQLDENATNEQVVEAYYEAKRQFRQDDLTNQAEALGVETKIVSGQNELRAEQLEKDREAYEQRRDIREQLAADLVAAEKDVQDRIKAVEIEAADPALKLELQRKAADDEIAILRTNLLRKKALIEEEKRIGSEAFQALSDAQKQARADALIENGVVQFSAEEEKQFQVLSSENWRAYYKGVADLAAANNETRLALIKDSVEREQKDFELGLNQQAEALRLAGATEEEILAFRRTKAKEFATKRAADSRAIEEQITLARVEAIKEGGDQSARAQEAAELQILQIKLDARKADLLALGDANDEQTRLIRQNLVTAIASLQGAITEIQANRTPLDIFDLLGIDFGENAAAQKKAVNDAVGNVIDLVEASLAAQRAEVDAQISATDELIEDRERRSDSLRDQLDQEIELAKLGLANNVDAVRAEIAENDRAAAAEKVRRAKLIEDQKKFARQQLVIEAAQQASALVTTGANLLVGQSLQGIVGVIAGIGFFASVLAAFTAFKARASAINSGSGPSFRKGGSSEGLIEGPSHGSQYGESGIAMIDRNTGKEVGEMEGGEFIVNRNVSVTHREIVEAMNGNDIGKVYSLARAELMGSGAVRLSSERVKEVVETKATYENRVTSVTVVENRALVAKVEELTKEVKAFRRDSAAPKDKVIPVTEWGYMILKANGSKETYRKRKD